jgi:glycosyltransferase involved in cell wall biosynthesis
VQPAVNNLAKKPRILIILNRFVIGGPAVDIIPLAWHLNHDFDIRILYGEKEKNEIEPAFLLKQYPGLQLKKMTLLRRSINPLVDLLAFFNVLYKIFTFKPHIVHTHGAKSGFVGRIAASVAGVPVIIHTFHGHFFHSYFSKNTSRIIALVERWLGKITTHAIALSSIQKNDLVEKYKILPSPKITIIQLGVNFQQDKEFIEARDDFRKNYGLKENDVAIGIIGRIVAVKNHSFFVNVVEQLLKSPPDNPVAFFIIGDGNLKNKVEKDLQQKDVNFSNHSITQENRVVFTSWLTDIDKVMNGLDVIVLTSLNEGTPLSIIEGQYFRKPVVCTNVGGVKDTMLDGKSGFLVNNNDVIAFTQKLRLLIKNKDLRKEMGEQGYKYVSRKFSKQTEIEATKGLYLYLLKEKVSFFR